LKRVYRQSFAAVLLGCFVLIAGLNTAAEAKTLTLRDATELAIEHNISIRLATSQIEVGKLTYAQSKKALYPSANFDASTYRQFEELDISPSLRTVSANVSANVNLFNGFADDANVSKQTYSLEATKLGYEQARRNLILQISAAYFDVATNQELVKIASENLDAQKAQLTLVEAYYSAGRRALADLYQQKASTAQAELDLLTAQNNLQVSRLNLFRQIGIAPDASYEIAAPSEKLIEVDYSTDLAKLSEQAQSNRPDLKQQATQLEAARQSIRIAHAGSLPKLGLSGQIGSRYQSNAFGSFSDQFDSRTTSIGLNLSIPLYDQSRTSLAVQQSKIALDNGQHTLSDLQRQVALEVEQAVLNLQSAVKQLAVSDTQVEFSQQSLAAMQERYNVGAATMVELTQARAQLVQASGNRIRTINKLLLARLSLGNATGDIDAVLAEF